MQFHPRGWRVDGAALRLARKSGPDSGSPATDRAGPLQTSDGFGPSLECGGIGATQSIGLDLDGDPFSGAAAFVSGLEHSGQAAAIVDKTGRVIALNARGQRQIRPTLRLRDGHLRATSRDMDGRLQAFIQALVHPMRDPEITPIEVAVLLEAGEPTLVLRGSPIGAASLDTLLDARAVVTFTDISRCVTPPAALLSETFGLTGTETAIALAVAHGEDLQAIAARKAISIQTVRSHLKAIFAKTNTRRQLALAVLITKLEGVAGHRD
jgi:DNA-binding CsgD family transcriptional regulator